MGPRVDIVSKDGAGRYVSAPVFGHPLAAEAANLFVVAAGDSAAIDRCVPLFDAVGQRLLRIGGAPAMANLVKLSGNFMIMAAVEAMAEAMTLAEKGGLDRAALLEVLTSTLFDPRLTNLRGDAGRGPLHARRLCRASRT